MEKGQLKQRIFKTIDENSSRIISLAKELQANPELGFQEWKTAEIIKREFRSLGLNYKDNIAITGIKTRVSGRKSDFNLCIMSELDALDLPEHVKADRKTGYAHACGHQAQMSMMLGAAIGLLESGVNKELDGDVTFIAVPAEELVQLTFREQMKKDGKILFCSGKGEFIRLGEFDDIDLFLMEHANGVPNRSVQTNMSWNGASAKIITFIGKSAHAGKSPDKGINALNAATATICCINMLRETFRDEDNVRVHYIIKNGGDMVNIVPERVTMELFVRANTFEAMMNANRSVKRAIRGAAYAMGTEVEINEQGGYMPLYPDESLSRLVADCTDDLFDQKVAIRDKTHCSASTDAGDVSVLKPIVQPMFAGFNGDLHTAFMDACDDEMAYVIPAKVIAATVIELLYDGAKMGKTVCENFKPMFKNKDEYVKAWDDFNNL